MTKQFILIGKRRIRISLIKYYEPRDETKIAIWFSVSKTSTNVDILDCGSIPNINLVFLVLDKILL